MPETAEMGDLHGRVSAGHANAAETTDALDVSGLAMASRWTSLRSVGATTRSTGIRRCSRCREGRQCQCAHAIQA
jgi:hypothetical protein